jgi:hypothetical protein
MAEDVAERGGFRQFEDLDDGFAASLENHDSRAISRDAGVSALRPGRRFEVIVSTHSVPLLDEKQDTCLSLLLASQLLG